MVPKDTPIEKREVTSLKVKPSLWKEAKIEAIRQDMELSDLVEKALEAWLGIDESKGTKEKNKQT